MAWKAMLRKRLKNYYAKRIYNVWYHDEHGKYHHTRWTTLSTARKDKLKLIEKGYDAEIRDINDKLYY